MHCNMKALKTSCFDKGLTKEQKELFKYAAHLGGFKTLSEFVIFSAQQQASNIIEKYNSILASRKDQEIFFNAIINPQKPTDRLKKAAGRFNKAVAKK
jgi:uncharacterized protein (DUF1778 family)